MICASMGVEVKNPAKNTFILTAAGKKKRNTDHYDCYGNLVSCLDYNTVIFYLQSTIMPVVERTQVLHT